MAIHKLKDGPVSMRIAEAMEVEGNYGKQVKFVGDDGVQVYVSANTAYHQLERANLTPLGKAVGQTLHFEQVQKNGKTFTNITAGRASAPVASAPAAPPEIGNLPDWVIDQAAAENDAVAAIRQPAPPSLPPQVAKAQDARGAMAFGELCALHTACVQHVLGHEVEMIGMVAEVSSETVSALAAQLFIEANRRGVVLPRAQQRAA